jgi:ribosomal protein S18 acetylase RimI-like enzyme
MNKDFSICDNLNAMLKLLGTFPGTRYSAPKNGFALYDSSIGDSFENYALLLPKRSEGENFTGDIRDTIELGLDFFERKASPHIWPIFPGVPDEVCKYLTERGLVRDEDFYAMEADLRDVNPEEAVNNESSFLHDEALARNWAECAWFGFDSEESPPDQFKSIVANMARRDEFSLFDLKGEATGMLCVSEGTAGIYYVATRPEFRRRGLGNTVMKALNGRARGLGCDKVTLLATPSGRPLYIKNGFEVSGTVKIYRTRE